MGLLSNPRLLSNIGPDYGISDDVDSRRKEPVAHSLQRQRRLEKDQIEALIRAYRAGDTTYELAQRFEIHRTTVAAHLERRGIPRRAHTRKLTDAHVQQAAAYYRAGEPLVTVAARFAVNAETLRRELRGAGVPIRPRRRGNR